LQGISKEPMPPTLIQDITNDNQEKYFHHYFANSPSLWRKYNFAMQKIVDYNIMWWLIEMSTHIGTTRSIL
jgi:predicted alpha/beta superfamily hydrolase